MEMLGPDSPPTNKNCLTKKLICFYIYRQILWIIQAISQILVNYKLFEGSGEGRRGAPDGSLRPGVAKNPRYASAHKNHKLSQAR